MSGDRARQSNPAMIALSIFRVSINATVSSAGAACWPLRNVSSDRNRVLP